MGLSTIAGDVYVQGNLSATSMAVASQSVFDSSVNAAAGIQATKIQQQYLRTYNQESATTTVGESRVVHVVRGQSGTVISFVVGNVVACASPDTITVDLLKNGTSILTATVSLTSTTTAYSVLVSPSGFSSTTLAQGDILEVKVTPNHTSGTLGKGVFAALVVRETPQ